MTQLWTKTRLSVSSKSYQLADTDRVALSFAAGEDIADATAELQELPGLGSAASSIESTTVSGTDTAVVVVSGLTRGETYELQVTFHRADDTTWTRTLALECVA